MLKNIKAAARLAGVITVGLPLVAAMAVLQGFIIGPILRNHNTIPKMFYQLLRGFTGIRIEFNKAAGSAPIETKRPTLFVGNHTSYGDFLVLGGALRAVFAGKGELLTIPGLRQLMMIGKYIGLRRDKKYNDESIGKIIRNFNRGNNTAMFPEATIPSPEPDRGVNPGEEVYMFHEGLFAVVKGAQGKIKGKKLGVGEDKLPVFELKNIQLKPEIAAKICVQPIAITVKDKAQLEDYTLAHNKGALSLVWKMLKNDVTVEVTAFPVLEPKNFATHRDIANEAHRLIASKVNPNQTQVWPAFIPGRDYSAKPRKPIPIALAPQ